MRAHVSGADIHFDVEGAGLHLGAAGLSEVPTILALPGGPGIDHGYLRPGLAPLARDAQIVYVDPRGHGRSGRPSLETCTPEQMADDVAALCAHLGIARPVVLGHSAGGFIALHLAVRHPALARGLVLCDTSPTFAPLPDGEPRPTLAARATPEVAKVAGRLFGGDFSDEAMQLFAEKVGPFYAGPEHMDVPPPLFALSQINGQLMGHFFKTLAPRYDMRPSLGEVRAPTLVVVGRHDWVCPPVASRTLARGIAGARLVVLEESGHFGFSEEPAAFQQAVRGFLAGLG